MLHGSSRRTAQVDVMTRIKAIVFDMDGVLIDAKEWHYEALNRALAQLWFLDQPARPSGQTYDGLPTNEKLEHAGARPGFSART